MLLSAVEIVTWIICFVCMYFTLFWLLVFLEHDRPSRRRVLRTFPRVTIVIPAYNEERSLAATIDSALGLDYPERKLEIIVVDDGSTDKTKQIAQAYCRKHASVRLISQPNSGKGVALNKGLRAATGEYFICLDADSFIEPDALKVLLTEFDAPDVACALPLMKARGAKNFLQRMQATEYVVNIFYKRLMSHLDCVHVAPGPFSVYRTEIVRKVGGFDEQNLTEDLEMTVRLQRDNYKIKQSMDTVVWTLTPERFGAYVRQRKRWYKGGLFNALRYKEMLFNKRWGDFGLIQLPILIISAFVSIALILITIYSFRPAVEYLWRMQYVGFDAFTLLRHLTFNLNLLDLDFANLFVALSLFCVSIFITYFAHVRSKEPLLKQGTSSSVLFLFVYFFLLGFVWMEIVFKDFLFGKKQRW